MPHTPHKNPTERKNRTLVVSGRSLIHAKKLPIRLWAEAVNTAAFVLNRTGPTIIKNKSPIELCTGKKVQSISEFLELNVMFMFQKKIGGSGTRKVPKGYFVGYCDKKGGFRVWLPDQDKVIRSRDVIFKNEQLVTIKPREVVEEDGDVGEQLQPKSAFDKKLNSFMTDEAGISKSSPSKLEISLGGDPFVVETVNITAEEGPTPDPDSTSYA